MKIFQPIVSVCLLIAGAVLLVNVPGVFIGPEYYFSVATIRIETTEPPAANFWQEQVANIRSQMLLERVISELNLQKTWAKRYVEQYDLKMEIAHLVLLKMLRVRQITNTSLVEITVFSVDKAEAAVVANKIGLVYCEWANVPAPGSRATLKASMFQTAKPAVHSLRNMPLTILKSAGYGIGAIVCILIGLRLLKRSCARGGALHVRSDPGPPPDNRVSRPTRPFSDPLPWDSP